MLRKWFIVFVCVYSLTGFSKNYYIPHIHTENDSWETYLIVDNNSSNESATFTLILRNGTEVVLNSEYELDPRGTQTISLREYSGAIGTVISDSCYIRVRLGYVAKESYGGGTAEFDTDSELNDTAVFSLSAYSDNLTWAGFALCNFVNDDVEVTARITLRNGTSMSVEPFTMTRFERKVNLFDEEFGISFQDIASVIFYTDQASLTGILISGNSLEKLLFTKAKPESTNWVQNTVISGTGRNMEVGGAVLIDETRLFKFSQYGTTPSLLIKEQNALTGENISFVHHDEQRRVRKVVASGNRIFLAGTHDYNYFVGELNTDSLEIEWEVELDSCPYASGYTRTMLENNIKCAVGESNMMVCLSNSGGELLRYLININTHGVIDSRTSDVNHLLGDVFYHDGYFYYFRSDRLSDESTSYSKLNLYYCPEDSLSGGGRVYTLPETDPEQFGYMSGYNHSVIQSGAYVEDNTLYITIQYCTVPEMMTSNYEGSFRGPIPGMIVFAAIDLSTRNIIDMENTFIPCQFGGRSFLIKDSEGDLLAFVANEFPPNQSTVIVPFVFHDESYSSYSYYEEAISVNMALIDPILTDNDDIIYSGVMRIVNPWQTINWSGANIIFGRKPFNEFLTIGPDSEAYSQ